MRRKGRIYRAIQLLKTGKSGMVSARELEKIIYNALKGVSLDDLKEYKEVTEEALTANAKTVENYTHILTVVEESEERFVMKPLRRAFETRKLLKARLSAIERRLSEMPEPLKSQDEEEAGSEEEDETEETSLINFPVDSIRVGMYN